MEVPELSNYVDREMSMFGLGPNLDVKKNLTLTCMLPMKVDFYMTKNGGTKIVGIFNIFHLNIEKLIGCFVFLVCSTTTIKTS